MAPAFWIVAGGLLLVWGGTWAVQIALWLVQLALRLLGGVAVLAHKFVEQPAQRMIDRWTKPKTA